MNNDNTPSTSPEQPKTWAIVNANALPLSAEMMKEMMRQVPDTFLCWNGEITVTSIEEGQLRIVGKIINLAVPSLEYLDLERLVTAPPSSTTPSAPETPKEHNHNTLNVKPGCPACAPTPRLRPNPILQS